MATTSIYRTPSAGDLNKWTMSFWVKRASIGGHHHLASAVTGGDNTVMKISNDDVLYFEEYQSSAVGYLKTTRVFRDPGAWYHIVFVWDTDNVTSGDRMILYVNGVRETDFTTETYPGSGQDSLWNSAMQNTIGEKGSAGYFDGSMSHIHFCDGYAYAASDFGQTDSTSGIWKIKTSPSVSYGTNGFFLKMEDRTNLDLDSSPNAHTFTTGGTLTATYDNPSNNFNTLSPLNETYSAFSHGNTTCVGTNAGDNGGSSSTLAPAAGKWYAECKVVTIVSAYPSVGVRQINNSNFNSISNGAAGFCGYNNYEVGFNGNGDLLVNNSVSSSWGSSLSGGDILQFAVDCDNGAIYIGVNNTWQNSGVPTSGATKTGAATTWTPGPTFQGINFGDAGYNGSTSSWNFGNGYFGTTAVTSAEADGDGIGAFEYAPPTGYFATCTKNIKAYGG